MRKISYRFVYNRKKSLNDRGTALVQVEAYLNKKKVYFSTHVYLRPEQWDVKRKIIKDHPNQDALNGMLNEFIIELEKKELSLWRQGKTITLSLIKEEFKSNTDASFLGFARKEIMSSQLKDSTKRNHLTTISLLQSFKPTIEFEDLTYNFVTDFEKFLYDSDYQTNTVAKHMKHLKSFVNAAINKGYIDPNNYAFRRYKIKMKEGKHVFLLPEEMKKLEDENNERIYKIYREKANIIKAEDIIKLREKYDISQRELTSILGFGKMTINRYERGGLPTKSQSDYIKLLIENDDKFIEKVKEAYEKNNINEKTYKKIVSEEVEKDISKKEVQDNIRRYLKSVLNRKPDIYNGYKSLDLEKVENIISYIASKVKNLIMIIHHIFYTLQQVQIFDFDKINDSEKEIIDTIIKLLKNKKVTDISEMSHREDGWRKTKKFEQISFEYAMNLNIIK